MSELKLAQELLDRINNLSPLERELAAAECMKALEPGPRAFPLFQQLARIWTLSTFEVTPFRSSGDNVEVLLGRRPDDDAWWPGQLHLPGNTVLPVKEMGIRSYGDLTDELFKKEFGDSISRRSDPHIYNAQPRTGERGSEQTVFAWAEADLSPSATEVQGGTFVNAEAVIADPEKYNLLRGHDLNIAIALPHYLGHIASNNA